MFKNKTKKMKEEKCCIHCINKTSLKEIINQALESQKEEIRKIINKVEKENDSNGRYNACQELLNLLK